ncbi:small RNA-binding protein 11, chloroplastic-like [Arachis stenosperma]|uniref:small RNA-binding protein 11, chloroplastic-like n=1 Tax=Arachis stenosperma TaxID=217475 RepID=UPI0025AD15F2|nr:small RNA-binding protein 11, chloroplastic-like [Arachis stenosperma]XP_057725821.1 small RNA-binding protein 11, chloroplastic-like [Arachis stenosperma]
MEGLRQIWCQQHRSLSQLLFLRSISSKIFVKGLAFSTTKEKLAEAFSEYGNVLNVDIVLNKAKNRSKGFGYVTFAKEEEARKAQMAMNGKILHGRVLYVDMEPNKKPEKSSFDKATTDG